MRAATLTGALLLLATACEDEGFMTSEPEYRGGPAADRGGGSGYEGEGEGAAEGEGEGPWEPGPSADAGAAWDAGMPGEGEGESPPPGCDFDEDCGRGHRCVRGTCHYVGDGDEPERPELPEEQRVEFGPVPVQGKEYVFVALPGLPA